jgi:hypothetical protein
MKHGCKVVFENQIAITFLDPSGRYFVQGKRVKADFPLTYSERRAYIEGGAIRCIQTIIRQRKLDIRDAKNHYDEAMRRP